VPVALALGAARSLPRRTCSSAAPRWPKPERTLKISSANVCSRGDVSEITAEPSRFPRAILAGCPRNQDRPSKVRRHNERCRISTASAVPRAWHHSPRRCSPSAVHGYALEPAHRIATLLVADASRTARSRQSPALRFQMDSVINNLKERARILKRETLTLYFAARDPRTAWYGY
jgi:hypothetical protein